MDPNDRQTVDWKDLDKKRLWVVAAQVLLSCGLNSPSYLKTTINTRWYTTTTGTAVVLIVVLQVLSHYIRPPAVHISLHHRVFLALFYITTTDCCRRSIVPGICDDGSDCIIVLIIALDLQYFVDQLSATILCSRPVGKAMESNWCRAASTVKKSVLPGARPRDGTSPPFGYKTVLLGCSSTNQPFVHSYLYLMRTIICIVEYCFTMYHVWDLLLQSTDPDLYHSYLEEPAFMYIELSDLHL